MRMCPCSQKGVQLNEDGVESLVERGGSSWMLFHTILFGGRILHVVGLKFVWIVECLEPAFAAALEGLVHLFSLPARLGWRLSCLIWKVPFWEKDNQPFIFFARNWVISLPTQIVS